MKVIILCGGLGTRLREETEFRPKPMVEIGDKPILWHVMKIYAHYGFNEFIICLGYKGEMVKEYFSHYELFNSDITIELGNRNVEFHSNHSEDDWRITLANTGHKALKGARIKKVEKYLDGDQFMLTYGDGIADIDIPSLLSFHKSHGKLVTVTGVNPASCFGELKIKGDEVESFSEKPQNSSEFINGGFFVCNKAILDRLIDKDDCDFEFGPLEDIANEGQLMLYKHNGFWACMDTLRDMEYLNKLWNDNKAAWKIW